MYCASEAAHAWPVLASEAQCTCIVPVKLLMPGMCLQAKFSALLIIEIEPSHSPSGISRDPSINSSQAFQVR
jgi:hypothetical protein